MWTHIDRLAWIALPLLVLLFVAFAATADQLRIAAYSAPLSRDGPGLLLRDIGREDPQIEAAAEIVAAAAPDILLLTNFDFDADLLSLTAFRGRLAGRGLDLAHGFALLPNSGQFSGIDLDRDGRFGEREDAQGYGRFTGDGGMAILSRFPILSGEARDFSARLWTDTTSADLPFLSDDARNIQRLSSVGHWVIPISVPPSPILLGAFAATAPVFDGPEDRNGQRNHDEILFWMRYLDGAFGPLPPGRFVLAGRANLDPFDGEGLHQAIRTLLKDRRLQDPQPRSRGGAQAGDHQHLGDGGLDTADWPAGERGPGNLRVTYILPAAQLSVAHAGVLWPGEGDELREAAENAGAHKLVWVDLLL